MNNPSRIFALVEDQRHRQFLYRFLLKRGLTAHQVVFEVAPSGRGSAEQWVRENFARQAGKCRARNKRAATGMFVVLDADTSGVEACRNVLNESLLSAQMTRFDARRDAIARLIPKRNIETWIHFLTAPGNDRDIDEEQDYKYSKTQEEWSHLVPNAAECLSTWSQDAAGAPENLIDSLRLGLQEIPRPFAVAH